MQQYKNYLEPPCGNSRQVVLQTLMRNITLSILRAILTSFSNLLVVLIMNYEFLIMNYESHSLSRLQKGGVPACLLYTSDAADEAGMV